MIPNEALSFKTSAKYQGIANILIPCANPETALAVNNKVSAFLFFNCLFLKL
jgi:hypothetical protein